MAVRAATVQRVTTAFRTKESWEWTVEARAPTSAVLASARPPAEVLV